MVAAGHAKYRHNGGKYEKVNVVPSKKYQTSQAVETSTPPPTHWAVVDDDGLLDRATL